MRNEKPLTIDEAFLLCKHFNCSLDNLVDEDKRFMTFKHFYVGPGAFDKKLWLSFIDARLQQISKSKEKQIIYAAKDPPIFQYLQFSEISAFKFFFWEKTLFHARDLEGKKFRVDWLEPEIVTTCKAISSCALQIPTIEIWNEDTFRILLRQIEYYWISGYFESETDFISLIDSIETWLNHNKKQAELGIKYLYGHKPHGIENSYTLYENEIVLNDNTISVIQDNRSSVFMTYNVLGLLQSTDETFCKNIQEFQKILISKANLISQVGEKERNRFFNKLYLAVENLRKSKGLK
ncbi:hypothetical protein [Carboxylicivirga sp. RSCT41]|uniref:hypothetical protein n=1 Tax=Carboxylicivirga agarovorans TaxID=3417570 RepID=UPI003D32E82D